MKKFILTMTAVAIYLLAFKVAASEPTPSDWVICDHCYGPAQFEGAAAIRHGERRGGLWYGVANTITEEVMFVQINNAPGGPGGVPMEMSKEEMQVSPDFYWGGGVVEVYDFSEQQILFGEEESENILQEFYRAGGSADLRAPSAEELTQAQLIIRTSKKNLVIVAPELSAFSSFSVANSHMPELSSLVWAALTADNPGWAGTEVASVRGLWNAIQAAQGKGPGACVIFNNGDSVCVQINPLGPSAGRVIDGTAQDGDGNPIAVSGALPNRANIGLDLTRDHPSSGFTSWRPHDREYLLVCGKVGNRPTGCYIQPL